MAFTVEFNTEPDSAHGDAAGVASILAVHRARERFTTEAEAVGFITRLPPLREPVLVMDSGERLRGPALSLYIVQWQANDAH